MTDTITIIGLIITFLLGLFNTLQVYSRNKTLGAVDNSTAMKTMNESVALANTRALDAEARASSLEERLAILEKSLGYRITFEVVLGTDPKVNQVQIERITTQ